MNYPFCSGDFKTQPYWWDETLRDEAESDAPRLNTDVLIIGAGYTGSQVGGPGPLLSTGNREVCVVIWKFTLEEGL